LCKRGEGKEKPQFWAYLVTRSYGRSYSCFCFDSCSHTLGEAGEAKVDKWEHPEKRRQTNKGRGRWGLDQEK